MNARVRMLRKFCAFFEIAPTTPFEKLTPKVRRYLMMGIPPEERKALGATFEGVLPNLKRRFEESESELVRERLLAYMTSTPCPACKGQRLKPAALAVQLQRHHARQHLAGDWPEHRASHRLRLLHLKDMHRTIAAPIMKEIEARLGFLGSVGLGYLDAGPLSGTLSGGRRSASAWPRRWAAAWWAWRMCWTSPPSACTSATTTACWPRCASWRTSATPCWWWSTTRT